MKKLMSLLVLAIMLTACSGSIYYDPYYDDYYYAVDTYVYYPHYDPYYDYYYYYENNNQGMKDLEKMAASNQSAYLNNYANALSEKFGLSADRSAEIAKLSLVWRENRNSMSSEDMQAFNKEVFGIDKTDVEAALNASNKDASLDELVNKVAVHNGLTPEQVESIFTNILN